MFSPCVLSFHLPYLPWPPWLVRQKVEIIISLSHRPRWPRQVVVVMCRCLCHWYYQAQLCQRKHSFHGYWVRGALAQMWPWLLRYNFVVMVPISLIWSSDQDFESYLFIAKATPQTLRMIVRLFWDVLRIHFLIFIWLSKYLFSPSLSFLLLWSIKRFFTMFS